MTHASRAMDRWSQRNVMEQIPNKINGRCPDCGEHGTLRRLFIWGVDHGLLCSPCRFKRLHTHPKIEKIRMRDERKKQKIEREKQKKTIMELRQWAPHISFQKPKEHP